VTAHFLIFAEDHLCYRLATELADRVVKERAPDDWLRELFASDAMREEARRWGPIRPEHTKSWTTSSDLKDDLTLSLGLDVRVDGKRPSGKVLQAQRAYQMARVARQQRRLTHVALVITLDTDKVPHIHDQMRKLVDELNQKNGKHPLPVVLALPEPESNAWVVAGFEPADSKEKDRHHQARQDLGFDPVTAPHRLNSTTSQSSYEGRAGSEAARARLRDAKHLCEHLLGEIPEPVGGRGEACWLDTPLTALETRATEAGLARFVVEVLEHLVPVLGGRTR
jgi:hypothetical protein